MEMENMIGMTITRELGRPSDRPHPNNDGWSVFDGNRMCSVRFSDRVNESTGLLKSERNFLVITLPCTMSPLKPATKEVKIVFEHYEKFGKQGLKVKYPDKK